MAQTLQLRLEEFFEAKQRIADIFKPNSTWSQLTNNNAEELRNEVYLKADSLMYGKTEVIDFES